MLNRLRYNQLRPNRPVKRVGNHGEKRRRGRQPHRETRHFWTWVRPKVNATDTHEWPYGRDNGKTKLKHKQDGQYECDCPWCRKHLVLVGVMPPVFPSGQFPPHRETRHSRTAEYCHRDRPQRHLRGHVQTLDLNVRCEAGHILQPQEAITTRTAFPRTRINTKKSLQTISRLKTLSKHGGFLLSHLVWQYHRR